MKVFISSFEFLAPGHILFPNVLLLSAGNLSFSFEGRDVRLYQLFLGRPNQPRSPPGREACNMDKEHAVHGPGVQGTHHGFSFGDRTTRLNREASALAKRAFENDGTFRIRCCTGPRPMGVS